MSLFHNINASWDNVVLLLWAPGKGKFRDLCFPKQQPWAWPSQDYSTILLRWEMQSTDLLTMLFLDKLSSDCLSALHVFLCQICPPWLPLPFTFCYSSLLPCHWAAMGLAQFLSHNLWVPQISVQFRASVIPSITLPSLLVENLFSCYFN
jgi:hypothetical protein